jgi:tetratricopeptide (TPR) repeat protein
MSSGDSRAENLYSTPKSLPLYQEVFSEIETAFQVGTEDSLKSIFEEYPAYAQEYLMDQMAQSFHSKALSEEKKKQIENAIRIFEMPLGTHTLHDLWVQIYAWTPEEKQRKREIDEKLKNLKGSWDQDKQGLEFCLDAYLALNDILGVWQCRLKKIEWDLTRGSKKNVLQALETLETQGAAEFAGNQAKIHLLKNFSHDLSGNMKESFQELQRAKTIFAKNKDALGLGEVSLREGELYSKTGYFEKARTVFEESLSIFKRIGNSERQASLFMSLGNLHLREKQEEKALHCYEEANTIYKRLQNQEAQAKVLNNIGVVYDKMGQENLAQSSYEESREIAEENQDHRQLAETENNLGNQCLRTGKSEAAIFHYKVAIRSSQKSGILETEIKARHNLGLAYFYSSQKTEGVASLKESLSLSQRNGFDSDAMESSFVLGKLSLEDGKKEEPIAYFRQCETLAKKIGNIEREKQVKDFLKSLEK